MTDTSMFEDLIKKLENNYEQQIKTNKDNESRISELEHALKDKDDKIRQLRNLLKTMKFGILNTINKVDEEVKGDKENSDLNIVLDSSDTPNADKECSSEEEVSLGEDKKLTKDDIVVMMQDFALAVRHGNEKIIKDMYDEDKHTLIWAIANGHLEAIEWLYSNINVEIEIGSGRYQLDCNFYTAALNGHTHVFRWLFEKYLKNDSIIITNSGTNEDMLRKSLAIAGENGNKRTASLIRELLGSIIKHK